MKIKERWKSGEKSALLRYLKMIANLYYHNTGKK
nr:MAG TPA: hypothetical protein [Bacteriophage sp.]